MKIKEQSTNDILENIKKHTQNYIGTTITEESINLLKEVYQESFKNLEGKFDIIMDKPTEESIYNGTISGTVTFTPSQPIFITIPLPP